jgi:hypothetical protein
MQRIRPRILVPYPIDAIVREESIAVAESLSY